MSISSKSFTIRRGKYFLIPLFLFILLVISASFAASQTNARVTDKQVISRALDALNDVNSSPNNQPAKEITNLNGFNQGFQLQESNAIILHNDALKLIFNENGFKMYLNDVPTLQIQFMSIAEASYDIVGTTPILYSPNQLVYENLWNGISLVFEVKASSLKYSLIVENPASLSQVFFHVAPVFQGNNLFIRTLSHGAVLQVYDTSNHRLIWEDKGLTLLVKTGKWNYEQNDVVDLRFKVHRHTLLGYSFSVFGPASIINKGFIIDPVIDFSTYFGGSLDDTGKGMYVDIAGYSYVTGETRSTDFPALNAAYPNPLGGTDAFLAKYSPNGTLMWSTYFGGSLDDVGTDVITDSSGNVYLLGYTWSNDLPTGTGFDSTFNGVVDVFLAKFNKDGVLLWASYYGGSGEDYSTRLAIDSNDAVYFTGYTLSTDLPAVNAFNATSNGGTDAFFAKVNATAYLVGSSYLGGSDFDAGRDIAVDSLGNVLVVGETNSTDYPLLNPVDTTGNTGFNAFVTKFSPTFALIWSTYLGGGADDYGTAIATDSMNYVYLTGYTSSTDMPMVNSYNATSNGGVDAFIYRLNDSGAIEWSTYFGGTLDDYAYGLDVAIGNRVVIGGTTSSTDIPMQNAYFSSNLGGTTDIFMAKFDSTGGLNWSTYLGGSASDSLHDLALDQSDNAFFTGKTDSLDFYVINAYDTTGNGGLDVFLTALPDATSDPDNDNLINSLEFNQGTKLTVNDTDIDGLLDGDEVLTYFTDPLNPDTDGDGMPDGWEVQYSLNPLAKDGGGDPDADTITNYYEYLNHTNPQSNDTDGDGMPDDWEINYGISPITNNAANDPDTDNLSNLDEYNAGTDPTNPDTDNDGMPDGWEVANNLNPTYDDSASDADSDGLTNLQEYTHNSNPNLSDSDGDGISDYDEVYTYNTEPGLADTDNDGLNDGDEINTYNTDPLVADTDNDGLNDGDEVNTYFTDPLNPDTDGDGMPDGWEVQYSLDPSSVDANGDADSDGVTNLNEYRNGTQPNNPDSDGDAITDYDEIVIYNTDPTNPDTDGDGLLDGEEINTYNTDPLNPDTDGDTLSDGDEVNTYSTNPLSTDTDNDSMPDNWEIQYGLDPLLDDSADDIDGDNLSNGDEYAHNTDPTVPDTDGDGMDDGWEVQYGLNPLVNDTLGDLDNDGLSNIGEYNYMTNPTLNDTDGDGMPDGWEVQYLLDPLLDDSADDLDGDTLTNLEEFQLGLDPTKMDTDGDGMDDGWEVQYGLNPLVNDSLGDLDNDGLSNIGEYNYMTNPTLNDTDGDGMPDGWEVQYTLDPLVNDSADDLDGDTLTNLEEFQLGLDPTNMDTDGDGMDDGWEVKYGLNPLVDDSNDDLDNDGLTNIQEYNSYFTDPSNNDTDSDGMPDGWEVQYTLDPLVNDSAEDLDLDGLTNLEEFKYGTDPTKADTDGDGYSDYDEVTEGTDPTDPNSYPGYEPPVTNTQGVTPTSTSTKGGFLGNMSLIIISISTLALIPLIKRKG